MTEYVLGILLRSPQEALRAALRHPLDGCRLYAKGTCPQYIVSTIPEALPPQGFVSFINLSCSTFTPYSLLPISFFIFESFLLFLKGQSALENQIVYLLNCLHLLFLPRKFRDDQNGNSTDTLWTAAATRQEGNLNSERLRARKALSKTTVRAPAPRYTRSLKTLAHLLQSPTMLRKMLTPSITVATPLENSQNPFGLAQAN